MGILSRKQIRGRAQARIGELRGTPAWGDPETWNDIIDESADEICRRTWCYLVDEKSDFTSGTGDYCLSQIFEIMVCKVFDSAGKAHLANPVTRHDLDRLYGEAWRSDPATGTPTVYATGGLSGTLQATFYPVPNYTTTGSAGFVFEGYGCPGASWSADTATCPLPDRAEPLLITLAAFKRAKQFPKLYGDHIAILDSEGREKMALLEREVIRLSEATAAANRGARRRFY